MSEREGVIYRRAREDDADEISALWSVANRARGAYVSAGDVDVVRGRITAAHAVGKVAEVDGRIVGVAILSRVIPGLAHLTTMAVLPDRWGQSIARTILRLLVEHARKEGYVELQLYVVDDNARARRLYELNGWKPIGEVVHTEHATYLRYVRST